jgi:lipoprotein-anchoring transpeptidase ErfK/SrfK
MLPSQTPRTSRQASFRSVGGRRTPGGIKAIAVAGLIVAGAVGGWMYFNYGDANPSGVNPGPGASVLPVKEQIGLSLEKPKEATGSLATEGRRVLATDSRPVNGAGVNAAAGGAGGPGGTGVNASTAQGVGNPVANQALAQPSGSGAPAGGSASPAAGSATDGSGSVPAISSGRDAAVERLISSGDAARTNNRPLEARVSYNRALHHPRASDADTAWVRQQLTTINDTLVFSTAVTPDDPLVTSYVVQPGDKLATIARATGVRTDWRFIQRVNKMSDPGRLRVGQKLKLVKGPFHAVVFKSSYRLDLYADATDTDGSRLFIRSFNVGLGEHNSTPTGRWTVKPQSKLVNPPWVNPRTGERFGADDPKNPIGEFWIGIQGADKNTEVLSGYGIHGTIDPESIGSDASMGCVRMLGDDIALVYELLVDGGSQIEILP